MDKILVEIPAYHDPELLNTVNSAIKQADYPDRVFFSICYQGNDVKDYNVLKKFPNCKIEHIKELKLKGLCYARHICQQMIEDEKYIYQIDSHMRFVKHWDTEMIKQLLSFNDKKAMISYHPSNFNDEMISLPVDDKYFDRPNPPSINSPTEFYDDNFFVKFQCRQAEPDQLNKLSTPFIGGGNLFTFADAQKQVPHDPKMCWLADELTMSIRYYTHGWNNYCPERSYIYHEYLRKNRAFYPGYTEDKKLEDKRFEQFLNLDHQNYGLGEYGLGDKRTLEQFEACTGINFSKKTIGEPTTQYSNI